jgi:hypothetical protein
MPLKTVATRPVGKRGDVARLIDWLVGDAATVTYYSHTSPRDPARFARQSSEADRGR